MDDQQLRHFMTRTVGAIAAQEAQTRALLVALVDAGLDPGAVARALDAARAPAMATEIGLAYALSMATFRAEVDRLDDGRRRSAPAKG